jgi:hypothetical protein
MEAVNINSVRILSAKVTNKATLIARSTAALYSTFGIGMAARGLVKNSTGLGDKKYYSLLRSLLYSRFSSTLKYQAEVEDDIAPINDGPIWVMWWQGIDEKTPKLVRACIDSIKRHSAGRDVIVISESNYQSFLSIPALIQTKIEDKTISLTNFSDYARYQLLYNYGGVWLDSSVYLSKDIDSAIADFPFYSASREEKPQSDAFSEKWTGFFLAGKKGNPLFKYWLDSYLEYWIHANSLVDYFLIDCLLKNAYSHVPQIQRMIDAVPKNNLHCHVLRKKLNSGITTLKPIDCTYVHKLTYKSAYRTRLPDNELSVYGALIGNQFAILENQLNNSNEHE